MYITFCNNFIATTVNFKLIVYNVFIKSNDICRSVFLYFLLSPVCYIWSNSHVLSLMFGVFHYFFVSIWNANCRSIFQIF